MRRVAISMEELVPLLQLQLQTSGSAMLNVTGGSMMPMLYSRRDSVKLAPAQNLKGKGQLILYRRDSGVYVLHRILRQRKGVYICCGDNQFYTEKIRPDQVLAVVTDFTRKGKPHSVEEKSYQLYVRLWCGFHPVRWVYLIPRRVAGWVLTGIRRLRYRIKKK